MLGIVTHLVDRFRRGQPFTIPPRELLIALALGAWALLMVPLSLWPGGSLAFLHNMYNKLRCSYQMRSAQKKARLLNHSPVA